MLVKSEWEGDPENLMDKFSSSSKFRKRQPGAIHTIHKKCSSLPERERIHVVPAFPLPPKSAKPSEHRVCDSNTGQLLLPQAQLPEQGWSWAKSPLSVASPEGPSMCLRMLVLAERESPWKDSAGILGRRVVRWIGRSTFCLWLPHLSLDVLG